MKNSIPLSLSILIALLFIFTTISCADEPTDTLNKNSQKYLSFYETTNDEQIHWEVNFDGNEIISIYKNGKRIPDELVDDYRGKVYNQLDEMRFGDGFYSLRMPDFNINMDDLHKNMEEFREKFKDHKLNLEEFKFDDEELKKEMEELRKKLKEHKFEEFKWKFDDEKFKERMKKLEEYLREHLDDFKFEFYLNEKNSNDDEV